MLSTPFTIPITVPTINLDFSPFLDSFAGAISSWFDSIWKFLGSPGLGQVTLVLLVVIVGIYLFRVFRKQTDR